MPSVFPSLFGALGVAIPERELEIGGEGSAPKPLLLPQSQRVLERKVEPVKGLLVGFGDKNAGAEFLPLLVVAVLGGVAGLPQKGVGKTDFPCGESGLDGVVSVSHFFDLFLSLLSLLCIYKKAFRLFVKRNFSRDGKNQAEKPRGRLKAVFGGR